MSVCSGCLLALSKASGSIGGYLCRFGCGAGSGFGWAIGCSSGRMGLRLMMEVGLSIARTVCTLGCWSSAGIACTICSDQFR